MKDEISQEAKIELIKVNVEYLTKVVDGLKQSMDVIISNYIPRQEVDKRLERIEGKLHDEIQTEVSELVKKNDFHPVRMLVYGFTGMLLTGVVGAIMLLVIGRN